MFDEFSTIQDLNAFENEIFNVLYKYCKNRDAYPNNAVLAINPMSLNILIDEPTHLSGFENYEIEQIISNDEPDPIAINEIARRYIFVS